MFGSNQSAAVQRAKDKVSSCNSALRDAERELSRTPRHENRAASVARDKAQSALRQAEAELRGAEADARR